MSEPQLPRVPARWRPALTYAATIAGGLAALAAIAAAAVWLYDHRNNPVLIPIGATYLVIDLGLHWANLRRWQITRDLADRAADDADRALGQQLAQANTDEIPAVVADLPRRRPRPYPPDDVDEQLKRFNFNGGRA